jgi:hypothetical protein
MTERAKRIVSKRAAILFILFPPSPTASFSMTQGAVEWPPGFRRGK